MSIQQWYWISDEYYGHFFELDIEELYLHDNSSTIRWTLHRYKATGAQYNGVTAAPTTLNINGINVYKKDSVTMVADGVFPAMLGSVSGEMSIEHDSDGRKTIFVGFSSNLGFKKPKVMAETYLDLSYIPPVPPEVHLFDLKSRAEGGHYFRFYGEEAVDPLGNYSKIRWTLRHVVTDAIYPTTTVSPITAKIGGTVVYETTKAARPSDTEAFPKGSGEVTGEIIIPHEKDGRKTIEVYLLVSFSSAQIPADARSIQIALTNISTDTTTVDTSIDTNVISGHKLSLKITETPDIPRNGSIISWSLYSTFNNADYQYAKYHTVYVKINKHYYIDADDYETVYNFTDEPYSSTYKGFPNTAGVTSGNIFIEHDPDGDAQLSVILGVGKTDGIATPVTEYTYTDVLTNTNRVPPNATVTLENSSQTEASFIITSDTGVAVSKYAKVFAKAFSESDSYSQNDLVVYNGALYKANDDISAGAWDPANWTEASVSDSDWTTTGLSYQQDGTNVRAVVNGLQGARSYAIIFRVAKSSNGIEANTNYVAFSTNSESRLISVSNYSLDSVSALTIRMDVFDLSYVYAIDIYTNNEDHELLGSKTNIRASSLSSQYLTVYLDNTVKTNAYKYLTEETTLPLTLVLHCYLNNVETSTQSANFTGYLTEANSKPYFSGSPELICTELFGKAVAAVEGIETFSTSKTYSTGDKVLYENDIYEALRNISAGDWDEADWQIVYTETGIYVRNASVCRLELTSTATPRSSNPANPVTMTYSASIGNKTQDGTVITENSHSIVRSDFSKISQVGNLEVSFGAVDSRQFRNDIRSSITVLDYTNPKVNAVSAIRNNNRLGTLLLIDGSGDVYPLRMDKVELTRDESVRFIVNRTFMTQAHAEEIYDMAEEYGLDAVQDLIKQYCDNVDTYIKFTNAILSEKITISVAYDMFTFTWSVQTSDLDTLYDAVRFDGIDSSTVTDMINTIAGGSSSDVSLIRKILIGTYNRNYITKAEVRIAKSSESYSDNWVDVTNYISQSDTAFVLACYEDPRIVADADYIYKLQLRVEDKLTNKQIALEVKTIPAGAPLMSFQKKKIGVNNRDPVASLDVYGFEKEVEGVITKVYAYGVDGYPITDHIVETGIPVADGQGFNGWLFKKYYSGLLEYFGTIDVNFTSSSFGNAYGGLRSSDDISSISALQYPIPFIEAPFVQLVPTNSLASGYTITFVKSYESSLNNLLTKVGNFRAVVERAPSHDTTIRIYIHAIGRWK